MRTAVVDKSEHSSPVGQNVPKNEYVLATFDHNSSSSNRRVAVRRDNEPEMRVEELGDVVLPEPDDLHRRDRRVPGN